jgi:hypothetical protein
VEAKAKQVFFFEKKNQKTFTCAVAALPERHQQLNSQSLLLLFFRKEDLTSCDGWIGRRSTKAV